VLIALAGLWSHRLLLVAGDAITKVERWLIVPLFAWGLAWTVFAGLDEIDHHVANRYEMNAAILLAACVLLLRGARQIRLRIRTRPCDVGPTPPGPPAPAPAGRSSSLRLVETGRGRPPFGRLGWLRVARRASRRSYGS
jgi:hypothetical protein